MWPAPHDGNIALFYQTARSFLSTRALRFKRQIVGLKATTWSRSMKRAWNNRRRVFSTASNPAGAIPPLARTVDSRAFPYPTGLNVRLCRLI
jgi:hypothetical protein